MSKFLATCVAVAAVLAVTTPPAARALTYDKLALVTFSGPVQVPGITLKAGTYRFALANAATSRNVLHVLSNDGSVVYAMFHTRSDWRATATANTTITFMETPTGVPPAAKTLFYGGEHHGYEFVYGKGEPNMTAEVPPQPQVTYTALPKPVATPEPMPVVELPETNVQPVTPEVQPAAAAPVELPKTASPLPFVALGGLSSLLLGLGLLRRRAT